MRQQSRGKTRESTTTRWARECPGQFLYVIRFRPEPRQRKRRKPRTPIAPWRPPVVMRPNTPAAQPKPLKQREDA